MNLDALLNKITAHPDYPKVGMVLCHKGVVRGSSRDGATVSGLRVAVDHNQLEQVIAAHKKRPGIVDVLVEINSDKDLNVGDEVMHLVVAGDIREHVVATLSDALNAIKSTVTRKTEYFVS